ncbi:MAG: T9SS type A sorting domain-containing protein [Chitinophagaceae bacterium]
MKKRLLPWLIKSSLAITVCLLFNTKSFAQAGVTLTTSPVAASNIAQGSSNNIVYIVKMDVTTLDATANNIQFTLTGTHDNNDLLSGLIWFNPTAPSLTGATALVGFPGTFAAPHTYNVGTSQTIGAGTSGYFIITFNIAATADNGHTIKLDGAANPVIFSFTTATTLTNNQTDAAGTQTIVAAGVTLTSSSVAASNIAQGTSNNIVYIVKMDVVTLPVIVSNIQFTLAGTHDADDLTQVIIWFNPTAPSLTGATGLVGLSGLFAAPHTYTSGLNQSIAAGASGYFIITVTTTAAATNGNTVKLNGAASPVVFGFTTAPSITNNQTDIAGTQTIQAAGVTFTTSPVAAANIAQGSSDNIVYIVKMDVTTSAVTVNSVQFTLTGTHDADDLSTVTLWFNATDPFLTGATFLNNTSGLFAAPHLYNFIISRTITAGASGYFIITVNTAAAATPGNTVKLNGAANPVIFGFTASPPVTNNQTDIAGTQTIFTTDINAPSITYTALTSTCSTGDRALNGVAITDASGVPISGNLQPRIYYKKNTGAWFSSQGILASGTATNGVWNFTIVAADMGSIAAGDIISYFVIAQDVVATPNIGSNPAAGLVAANVNTITTYPTTPTTYSINPLPTITLGASPSVCRGTTSANLSYSALTGSPNQYSIDYDATAEAAGFVDLTNASLPSSPILLVIPGAAAAATYNATLTVRNSTTGCVSNSSTAFTVTINPLPTITLGASPTVCQGTTSANLSYSATTGSPNQYSIDYDATAEAAGFADITNASLPASQILLIVPGAAPAATYNATITVRNSTTGCVSSSIAFTVTINPPATVSAGGNQTVCAGSTVILTGSIGGAATSGTWSGGTGTFTPNATTLNAVYTASAPEITAGTVILTLTTDDPAGPCGAVSSNMTITITASSGTLAATAGGPQVCRNMNVGTAATYSDPGCNIITKVVPTGASPVSGMVNTCVKIETTTPVNGVTPYLTRHWDITPATNPSTATATITLYFTPAEATTYNSNSAGYRPLPVNNGDDVSSVRVHHYHGNNGGGGIFDYPGTVDLLVPSSVVWDGINSRWEVTVAVVGFSGDFITTPLNTPLPITLLSFSGYKQGSVNVLKWTTTNEQNNFGFELQRSTDGISYTVRGFVNSLALGGNSNGILNYTFTDNNPAVKQFYRLRQVDFDQRSKLSSIVLIKGEKPITLSLDGLFPNPAATQVNIIIATPSREKVTVKVTDMTGRIVVQKLVSMETGSNTVALDISRLTNGSYLVKLVCSNYCENSVGKFVKQ